MVNLPRAVYQGSVWLVYATDFPNNELILAHPEDRTLRKYIEADTPDLEFPINS